MIVFSEDSIVQTTLAEITGQGYVCQNHGTVIELYKDKTDNKLYWHNDKQCFFTNTIPTMSRQKKVERITEDAGSTPVLTNKPYMNETFKVIVAGSRYYTDYRFVKSKLDFILQNKKNIEIVSGACNTGMVTYVRPDGTSVCGADGLGERYAAEKGHAVKYFPADWSNLGKKAGMVRNKEMAVYAAPGGGCIVFRLNMSPGSTGMANLASTYKLKTKIYDF